MGIRNLVICGGGSTGQYLVAYSDLEKGQWARSRFQIPQVDAAAEDNANAVKGAISDFALMFAPFFIRICQRDMNILICTEDRMITNPGSDFPMLLCMGMLGVCDPSMRQGKSDPRIFVSPPSPAKPKTGGDEGEVKATEASPSDEAMYCKRPRFLNNKIIDAYGEFLIGKKYVAERHRDLISSHVLAKEPVLWYLASEGIVQSSKDIQNFLEWPSKGVDRLAERSEHPDERLEMLRRVPRKDSVVSGDEVYEMESCASTVRENFHAMLVDYEFYKKKYNNTNDVYNSSNANKFAFLWICKKWNIKLNCSSISKGMTGNVFDPEEDESSYIIDIVDALSSEKSTQATADLAAKD